MTILIDTGVFYAFFNKDADRHKQAFELFTSISDGKFGKPILLDYVFDELITLFQHKVDNTSASEIGGDILQLVEQDFFTFMQVSVDIFRNSWDLFKDQGENNRPLSFTDCCLIATTKVFNIAYLASFDKQFKSFHPTLP